MGTKEQLILVAGATGRQGGATARHLLKKGFAVRALTRHASSQAAKTLVKLGAEVFEGDLNDRDVIDDAIHGCHGVFSVQTFHEQGLQAEVQQGQNLADAARTAGVKHFVYSSVGSANQDTGIPHFESKWQVEQYVSSLRLPATILRPTWFMDNFSEEGVREAILSGRFSLPLRADKPLQMIAVDDIGGIAAAAFDQPRHFIGRQIDLAGDELTMTQVAEQLGQVLGHPVRYAEEPIEKLRLTNREWAMMFDWFNDVGYSADIQALRRDYPPLRTFSAWLYDAHWERLAQEAKSK